MPRLSRRFHCGLLLFCLLLCLGLPAQVDTKGVHAMLDKIVRSPGMDNGQFGFVLIDLESGKVLEQVRPDETMLPASTMKTVTSAAAFSILGPDYKFKTQLQISGQVEDGILKGNVIIRGGGDPTLGSDRYSWGTDRKSLLAIWVKALREMGIRKIEGDIIGDASLFEDALVPVNWVWNDIGNYYGAGACGLSFNENSYALVFQPGKSVGTKAELLRTDPPMSDVTFVNEMRTGSSSSGDNGYVYGAPYTFTRTLKGTVPLGDSFVIKGSIPDPALFTAKCLDEALWADSIMVLGRPTTIRHMIAEGRPLPTDRQLLHTHESPPLKDIVYWLNKKSINLYAEHLVKTVGLEKAGEGSTAAGTKVIAEHWAAKGVPVTGLHMDDGSGLSRYNGITPRQLALMLQLNAAEPWFPDFLYSLPIAGKADDPGTLKSMCNGTAAEGKVCAKSGYISRVRTYAGYVETKSGRKLCFAMMANNYTCSNAVAKGYLEDLMVAMAETP